jgi:hypothetical protein
MQDIAESFMHTLVSQDNLNDDDQRVSSIRGWLIDSGASSHMTPNQHELQYNIEPSTAIVEVANGLFIRAQRRGTVQIRLTDINDSRRTCDILVHDVMWVPGLSRRLLSVDQWMADGGAIHFNADHTTICVVDRDTNETHSFDVPKPFPAQFSPPSSEGTTAYHVNTRSTQPTPKRAISRQKATALFGRKNVQIALRMTKISLQLPVDAI